MIFNIKDLLEFAVRIEENGREFYEKASNLFEKEIRSILLNLAREEDSHGEIFKSMLREIERPEPAQSFEGEYLLYLKEFIDNKVVFSQKMKESLFERKDIFSIIDFAMDIEKESIIFYDEMKRFIPSKDINNLERIIEEEKRHFITLSEKKRFLQGG